MTFGWDIVPVRKTCVCHNCNDLPVEKRKTYTAITSKAKYAQGCYERLVAERRQKKIIARRQLLGRSETQKVRAGV